MTFKHLTGLFLLLAFCLNTLSAQSISDSELKKNLVWLSADKREGRGTGTKQERKAADYIAKQFKKIGLQPKGDNNTWYHNFTFKKSADPHGNIDPNAPSVNSRNVVAFLDNGAPYTIVIGAHYDHLGLGYDHNSLDPKPEGQIHNGADDNASGTSGVIELARHFANNNIKEQHNYLFICFSGEELGLIGSKKFAETPTIDLTKVSYMVNLDMIGRLNEDKRIMVGGVGTAPDFVPAVNNLKGEFTIKLDSAGVGPSDHTSFYLKNIPVLFVFTGQHGDYHKPSDDADKINYAGERMVLDLVIRIMNSLDAKPKLTFQETKTPKQEGASFKVTLGIMPDYTWEKEGVHVDNITEGRPAAKAGIQKGDIIVKLGDINVVTIQDYMKGLSMFKKGDTTTVKVKRGTEEKEMSVTF